METMRRVVRRRGFELQLLALSALLLPSALCGTTDVPDANTPNTNDGLVAGPPSPTPWNRQPDVGNDGSTQSTVGESSRLGANAGNGIDFLVAAFFLIAAGWLVLALIYSILVLIVVRLRARGQLDVYDENFGRLYLLGTRWYIPFGCVLRRYVIAMTRERTRDGAPITVRLMTRDERRMAMEKLLDSDSRDEKDHIDNNNVRSDGVQLSTEKEVEVVASNDGDNVDWAEDSASLTSQIAPGNEEEGNVPDDASEEGPVCTICLNEYEPTDVCYTSKCSHRFHRECLLDWLQRRANTECPCCRTPLVTDEEVWETVQEMREERRRQIQKANRGRGVFWRFRGRGGNEQSLPEQDEATVEATPPSSPTALTSFASSDDTQS